MDRGEEGEGEETLAVPCLSIGMFALHIVYIQSYFALSLLAFFTYIVQTRASAHRQRLARQSKKEDQLSFSTLIEVACYLIRERHAMARVLSLTVP